MHSEFSLREVSELSDVYRSPIKLQSVDVWKWI